MAAVKMKNAILAMCHAVSVSGHNFFHFCLDSFLSLELFIRFSWLMFAVIVVCFIHSQFSCNGTGWSQAAGSSCLIAVVAPHGLWLGSFLIAICDCHLWFG